MNPDVETAYQLPALMDSSLSKGELIPLNILTPQELAMVDTIAKSVDLTDADAVLKLMSGPRQRFADAITAQLEGLKVYETGAAAGVILELSRQIKATNLQKMRKESTGEDWVAANFGKLPVIGPMVSAIRHFQLTHKRIVDELDRIKKQAQKELNGLSASNALLKQQEEATYRMLREMMVHIAGCEKAVAAARPDYDQRRRQLAESRDPFELQRLTQYGENIVMLETRILNAKTSFVGNMLAIPDIQAKAQAARIEMANTMDTIQNDIPDLAAIIGRLVAVYNIAQAQKGTKLRQANRQALAEINQTATRDVYLAAKASQGSAIDEVERLSQRLDSTLAMLADGLEIDRRNVGKREEASRRLYELRNKLLDGLADHAQKAVTAL